MLRTPNTNDEAVSSRKGRLLAALVLGLGILGLALNITKRAVSVEISLPFGLFLFQPIARFGHDHDSFHEEGKSILIAKEINAFAAKDFCN